MALLDKVITTRTPAPPKLIVYGQPGVGKTTMAAQAEALLIDCENGAGNIAGLQRTPYVESWPEMREWLVELANASSPPPVVAIDTIDWMIRRIIEYVVIDLDPESRKKPEAVENLCRTIGSAHGGWFKARDIVVNAVFRELFPLFNAITRNGSALLLLAHAENKRMQTPEGASYKTAAPDFPEWIMNAFIEWADAVLYASVIDEYRTLTAIGTNVVLAKNRYGLPKLMPLEWSVLMDGIVASTSPATTETGNN